MPAINVSQHHMDVVNHLMQMLSLKSKTKLVEEAIEDYEKKAEREKLSKKIRDYVKKYGKMDMEVHKEVFGAAYIHDHNI